MPLESLKLATERIGSRSLSTSGFSMSEGGRASIKLIVDEADMEDAVKEALGDVGIYSNRIDRTPPIAHPHWQWMFCERISNIEGIEFDSKIDATEEDALFDTFAEVPPLPFYARYKRYELTLDFAPRPYPIIKDTSMEKYTFDWYDETGALKSASFAAEWQRYCESIYRPAAEYLTAAQGQLVWKMDANPAGKVMIDKPIAGGQIRQLIRSTAIDYIWHDVPYNWITDSRSKQTYGIGYINQTDWNTHKAGSLLLASIDVSKPYAPPFPKWRTTGDILGPGNLAAIPSQFKLCTITFNMLKRDQAPTQAYTVPAASNNVAYGHNLILNAVDGKWYYAENKVSGKPLYPSYDFAWLFAGPEA